MLVSIFKPLHKLSKKANSRALDKALEAAKNIKKIENEHFQGQAIAFDPDKGKTVSDYFQTQLDQQLLKVRYHLSSFRVSGFLFNREQYSREQQAEILNKLEFIEGVLKRYRDRPNSANLIDTRVVTDSVNPSEDTNTISKNLVIGLPKFRGKNGEHNSLVDAVSQIRRELSPQYEDEVIESVRAQKREKEIAIRWLLILLLIPLFFQIVTRNLVFEPLFDYYRDRFPDRVQISEEVSERFLTEYNHQKDNLEIATLLGLIEEERKQEKLQEMAQEIYQEAGYRSLDAYKNIAADGVSLAIFIFLAIIGRKQLIYIRMFIDRIFRSLNDIAKVYLFILLTDLFVGFHSAEGWEVILQGIAHHFGLPENDKLVYIFIATVPVILDSTFKLWIFVYLTRSSPTSVAIYEKMNQ
ncbi:MAG: CemA family protein [Gloeocapsa sp. DLM2.Bin57]|nr:MAG: CemA family protein [Gloeocapsa sp. DLM2.Bin57]